MAKKKIMLPEGHLWKEVEGPSGCFAWKCGCGASFLHDVTDDSIEYSEGAGHESEDVVEDLAATLRRIGKSVTAFDRVCSKGQGTDIDAAWGLMYDIRRTAYAAARSVPKQPWWTVVGHREGYEDSCLFVQAKDKEGAVKEFVKAIMDDGLGKPNAKKGTDIYVMFVIDCGLSKPTLVEDNV